KGKGRSLSSKFSAHRSLLGQVEATEGLDPGVLKAQSQALEALGSTIFLDLNPRRMRDYVSKHASELGAEGENLSSVLYALTREEEQRQALVDWLSSLCAPEVQGVDFVETALGDVMLRLVEHGEKVSVRSLSDGTLRFLGLLAALLTAKKDSTLLVEEIDNGLHPSRIHLLAEWLEVQTAKRRFQVIATTHSPLLLERLSRKTLANALLFARVEDKPETLVRRLGDLPDFDRMLDKKGFEYLFTTRWLERAL
ncbi:MAG: AAA family ATPase, partial [Candidatus Eremiobacterota bacterium]